MSDRISWTQVARSIVSRLPGRFTGSARIVALKNLLEGNRCIVVASVVLLSVCSLVCGISGAALLSTGGQAWPGVAGSRVALECVSAALLAVGVALLAAGIAVICESRIARGLGFTAVATFAVALNASDYALFGSLNLAVGVSGVLVGALTVYLLSRSRNPYSNEEEADDEGLHLLNASPFKPVWVGSDSFDGVLSPFLRSEAQLGYPLSSYTNRGDDGSNFV